MRTLVVVAALALSAAAWGTAPARGGDKGPSKKTRDAVEALKADLAAFEVRLYAVPGRPGNWDDDPTWVKLVTDARKAAAKPKQAFAITEKQAAALIDYLAESGMFDRQATDPPGPPYVGWYVAVTGGKPARRLGYWRYDLDVAPATVGVVRHLTEALDGDAKAAVQGFRKGAAGPKR